MRLAHHMAWNSRRRSGFTLIEMLVVGLMSALLGAGLWTLLRSGYNSQYILQCQNSVNASSRQAVDILADYLRGATALSAATASDVTFTNSAGQSVRFWRNNGSLVKSVNGAPAAGTAVATNISALSFTYYTWNGSSWTSSSTPGTPANVGAVDFTVTATWPGTTTLRTVSGSVRIRQK